MANDDSWMFFGLPATATTVTEPEQRKPARAVVGIDANAAPAPTKSAPRAHGNHVTAAAARKPADKHAAVTAAPSLARPGRVRVAATAAPSPAAEVITTAASTAAAPAEAATAPATRTGWAVTGLALGGLAAAGMVVLALAVTSIAADPLRTVLLAGGAAPGALLLVLGAVLLTLEALQQSADGRRGPARTLLLTGAALLVGTLVAVTTLT